MPKNDRIKFRFWSKTHAKYVYCASLNDLLVSDRIPVWENGNLLTMEKPDDIIPEQCTGLTDNNGDLIFEGDIICTNDKTVGVVKLGQYGGNDWEGWHFGYYIDWLRYADINNRKPTLRKDFWFWVEHRAIEIIGNIHENRKKKQ